MIEHGQRSQPFGSLIRRADIHNNINKYFLIKIVENGYIKIINQVVSLGINILTTLNFIIKNKKISLEKRDFFQIVIYFTK